MMVIKMKDELDVGGEGKHRPLRILALTFLKEAAWNMREKVEKLLQGKEIHVKTFHSYCAELIKDHADRCKVPEECGYGLYCGD